MMETAQTHTTVAPLRNVAALAALIDRIRNRADALPGMGTFYGPSGFGKTTAAIYCTNKFRAVNVQIKSVWTKKTICEAILAELGLPPAPTIARMLDQISQTLAMTDAPLLIDEADFLVQRKMIEIVRDIYESSGAPIVLIGEELLPQKLQAWERVHGRMLDWVPAQPGDKSDLKHLAKIYARDITIEDDLLDRILKASNASIRRMCVNLDRVSEYARVKGLSTLGADAYDGQAFFTGQAPEVRRFGRSA